MHACVRFFHRYACQNPNNGRVLQSRWLAWPGKSQPGPWIRSRRWARCLFITNGLGCSSWCAESACGTRVYGVFSLKGCIWPHGSLVPARSCACAGAFTVSVNIILSCYGFMHLLGLRRFWIHAPEYILQKSPPFQRVKWRTTLALSRCRGSLAAVDVAV